MQCVEFRTDVSFQAGWVPPPDERQVAERLLRRIAERDPAALEDFYRLSSARALGFLRQLCKSSEQAEDLLQEVFLAVWRKAASYDPSRGDAMGWLFSICRHKFIDSRRRHHPTAELDGMAFDPPAPAVSHDLPILLDKAMRILSGPEREALRLAYYGGLTYEETALHLALPLGTLKSRIRMALRKIAAEIGEHPA